MIGMIMARVFVSNLTKSMMRNRVKRVSPGKRRDQAHKQRGGLACNWRVGESRTNSPGHFNSSRLMKVPPSWDLIFFWTRLVDNSSEACWNVSQLFEFLVGTVLGGLCKLASPAFGMGTQEYVPIGSREPEVKISLPLQPSTYYLRGR